MFFLVFSTPLHGARRAMAAVVFQYPLHDQNPIPNHPGSYRGIPVSCSRPLYWCVALGVFVLVCGFGSLCVGVVLVGGGRLFRVLARLSLRDHACILPVGHE